MSDKKLVISVLSRDRVGLIADITGAISELRGDLADLSETVLDGYLTMILVASFPDATEIAYVREKILAASSDAEVLIKPIPVAAALTTMPDLRSAYVMTAVGRNRIGLVAQVSTFCKQRNLNILDLTTTVEGDTYTMILLIDLSAADGVDILRRDLSRLGEQAGLNIVLQHNDIFRATNEI